MRAKVQPPILPKGKPIGGPLFGVRLTRFTAFRDLEMKFSPGINILVGANGTGKTHILKALYAACDITTGQISDYPEKLIRLFMPSADALGRLVKRQQGSARANIRVYRDGALLHASFAHNNNPKTARVNGGVVWRKRRMKSVYIPVKEMLANAPGFLALYNQRNIHFEEVYADILYRAYSPVALGPTPASQRRLLQDLRKTIQGRVEIKGQEFFLHNQRGNLEFSLLAEGMRKLGLLWLLIRNGTFVPEERATLFWDEPETNLNPKMFRALAGILLQLQRDGAQIFLATHSYELLKEFDLQVDDNDKIAYHSLFEEGGDIRCNTASHFLGIDPNAIAEAWDSIYERQLKRSLEKVRP